VAVSMGSEEASSLANRYHILPAALLALALLLGLVSFAVGWFSVDTRVQVWEFDPQDPQGKGNYTGFSVRVHNQMKPLELDTRIEPSEFRNQLESLTDLPSYDEHMPNTGTAMLGVFLLNAVAVAALAAAGGFFLLHRRVRKDFNRTVWKFAGLFAVFALLAMLFLGVTVPSAARTDTRDVLQGYMGYLQNNPNFPSIDPRMLEPNVKFWNTWVCCPPDSHFQRNQREYLVVVTAHSRPAAGFLLAGLEVMLVGAALALGHRTGQLQPKLEGMPVYPPAAPPKVT
jgi:hypothetical protein